MEKSNPSQVAQENGLDSPDFRMAKEYLELARTCHESGDEKMFKVACYMLGVSLGLTDENNSWRQRPR